MGQSHFIECAMAVCAHYTPVCGIHSRMLIVDALESGGFNAALEARGSELLAMCIGRHQKPSSRKTVNRFYQLYIHILSNSPSRQSRTPVPVVTVSTLSRAPNDPDFIRRIRRHEQLTAGAERHADGPKAAIRTRASIGIVHDVEGCGRGSHGLSGHACCWIEGDTRETVAIGWRLVPGDESAKIQGERRGGSESEKVYVPRAVECDISRSAVGVEPDTQRRGVAREAQFRGLAGLAHGVCVLAAGSAEGEGGADFEAQSGGVGDHGGVPHGVAIGVSVVAATLRGSSVVDLAVVVQFFAWVGVVDVFAFALHVVDAVVDGPLCLIS
jgi:hypothetical protein